MIRNLKDTTQKNAEQDWLKTNLAKFSRMLQGQKDLLTVAKLILSEIFAPVACRARSRGGVLHALIRAKKKRCSSCSRAMRASWERQEARLRTSSSSK